MSRQSPYIVSDKDDDPANSSDDFIDLIDDGVWHVSMPNNAS
jgi:hypothetical protein